MSPFKATIFHLNSRAGGPGSLQGNFCKYQTMLNLSSKLGRFIKCKKYTG